MMQRAYSTGDQESITYFTGVEIEHTPAYGMRTLFVVGIQRAEEIIKLAKEKDCGHIYFGANQSFPKIYRDDTSLVSWEDMIVQCLDAKFWCTLDLDIACAEVLLEGVLVKHRRFIPQLSIKLPCLTQLGYNATIKLDDKDFDATNPGVWCHQLRDLTTTESFTNWDQYDKDEIIK